MRLSPHFSLHEFTRSQTATRRGINNTPSSEHIDNLKFLTNDYLEIVRKELDSPIIITSGYRSPQLNRAIRGSKTSDHRFGLAADFVVIGFTPIQVCRAIRDLELPYDQNIHEFGEWTHLGVGHGLRRQDLTAWKNDSNITVYTVGIHEIEDLRNGDG